jgi:pimeloyl-ACP methyl ester carboxylesterase
MGWIAPAVSQDTRVCVYDRAGHGWSDPADGPQDAVETARDLHTLLDRAPRPRAAGIHRTQPGRGPTRQGRVLRPHRSHLNTAVRLIPDSYDSLPARSRDEARATVSTARSAESYLNELRAGAAATRQAAAFSDFAGKPLIVVTAAAATTRPGKQHGKSSRPSPPTAAIASSPTPPTPRFISTRLIPPQPARPSAMSSRPCDPIRRFLQAEGTPWRIFADERCDCRLGDRGGKEIA